MAKKDKRKVRVARTPKRGRAPHKPTRPHKDPTKYNRRRDKKDIERGEKKEK